MGQYLHLRRRARALPVLAAVALTALFSAAAVQAASAARGKAPSGGGGQPPCPSCPDRTPPAGGAPPSSTGGSGPTAAPARPLFSLGTITSGNGLATVTGTVNRAAVSAAGAGSSSSLQLSVNGNQVGISAGGNFSATTNASANGGVTVQANDQSAGLTYSITVPASSIPSNGVAANALAQVNADKVTLMMPVDGFVSVDGNGTSASVQAAGTSGIAHLTLNGTNVLAKLQPGASGSSGSGAGSGASAPAPKPGVKPGGGSPPAPRSASAPVSGSAKTVKLSVTATNGANQTTTVRIQRIRTVIRFGRELSVSAFGARGIRITKVVFDRSSVQRTGKLGVAVTVRDRRNYLVRDAVVMLQPYAHHTTIRSSWAHMSNALGRATFRVPVGSSTLGRQLYLRVTAQTPLAKTHVTKSVYLLRGAA